MFLQKSALRFGFDTLGDHLYAEIMRHADDPHSFISTLTVEEVNGLIENKIIQQGMIPKVRACVEALNGGVKKTHIINARTPHGLLLEIFTDHGIGTEIIR